jgi:hypothetical protein
MQTNLAEQLFSKIMTWSAEDLTREMPNIEALAVFKYDQYEQYFSGMKYIESLARWLNQFKTQAEKIKAFEFVNKHLIFVSSTELSHFVAISFPDVIRPFIIKKVAAQNGIPEYNVNTIIKSREYQTMLRQSLFLGLSDGAHTDIFRRSNPEISNEQIYQTYEITEKKAKDMLKKLNRGLSDLHNGTKYSDDQNRFHLLFLLDDFSASGISYLRYEDEDKDYDGKIFRFYKNITDPKNPMYQLIDHSNCHICVILYIATNQAIDNIQLMIRKVFDSAGIKCDIFCVYRLNNPNISSFSSDTELLKILEDYFDDDIIDEHYEKGKFSHPYLGFDECALPLILNHNTPNNSIPLLWFEENRKYWGLFPRVSRHGGVKNGNKKSL